MADETKRVLDALTTLREELPGLIAALKAGELTVAAQHRFAASLIETGELVDEHADHQASASNGHADGFGMSESGDSDDIDDIVAPSDNEEEW
ncbi:hypothetical protein BAY61_25165 [Prauserella marina]|uniref:Uncharacterized protein n=1 Tax=Prauserella marina TaxID=530584 RepID=A0A222VV12_9PSEU|nr:hypothetical protein [Prauserella marina]ASR37745.1 hypothetical protein BAY61_25165 [Prauserella marina]PWV75692.1 hypothetical protein DES30_106310 [Prauserella marina]SDD28609.1 hypothetical protein SAMN05421630_107131 [Prauserella marina]